MTFEGVRSFLNGLLISEGGVAGSERWEVSPQNWWGKSEVGHKNKWEVGGRIDWRWEMDS